MCRSRFRRSWRAWCCSACTAPAAPWASTSPTPRPRCSLRSPSSRCRSWCVPCSRSWNRLDPDVERAARSLGASGTQTWTRVLLPALAPAIAAGAAMSFARAVSEYGALVLISGNLALRTEVTSVRILTYVENGQARSSRRRGDRPARDRVPRARHARHHSAKGGPPWLTSPPCPRRPGRAAHGAPAATSVARPARASAAWRCASSSSATWDSSWPGQCRSCSGTRSPMASRPSSRRSPTRWCSLR
ncbi:ABC transporter permease subunit [Demequina litorisediminis]|uniref:ABC transporter permease subunit n=1 Tax=Demequina litorisediminis TaxID=1849022 RepID=UPI003D66A81F